MSRRVYSAALFFHKREVDGIGVVAQCCVYDKPRANYAKANLPADGRRGYGGGKNTRWIAHL